MNERWRADDDEVKLESLPQDNISPVRLTNVKEEHHFYDSIPRYASDIANQLGYWIKASVENTLDNRVETAFYVDYYGNIIGLIEGEKKKITYPTDNARNVMCSVHTHTMDYETDGSKLLPTHSKIDIKECANTAEELGVSTNTVLSAFSSDAIFVNTMTIVDQGEMNPDLFFDMEPKSIESELKTEIEKFIDVSDVDVQDEVFEYSKIDDYVRRLDNLKLGLLGSKPLTANITTEIITE